MNNSSLLIFLKIFVMIIFFLIVVFVGSLPIRSKNFKRRPILRALGATFAGALFINVSIIHILPQSAESLESYLREVQKKTDDEQVFPLANLLLMVGFLTTIFFTKVISFHSHQEDHQAFENQGSQHQANSKENSSHFEEEEKAGKSNDGQNIKNPDLNADQNLKGSLLYNRSNSDQAGLEYNQQNKSLINEALILTVAMYFHTIFEGIAIGVQDTVTGFLSIAVAIAFHKWADALSMGCHYKTKNLRKKLSYGLIFGQAVLNVLSIGIGWVISSSGEVVEAIFLSISAGTFLAISTFQMLGEQLHHKEYIWAKFGLIIVSTAFVSVIWFLQNSIFGGE